VVTWHCDSHTSQILCVSPTCCTVVASDLGFAATAGQGKRRRSLTHTVQCSESLGGETCFTIQQLQGGVRAPVRGGSAEGVVVIGVTVVSKESVSVGDVSIRPLSGVQPRFAV
jgi:hypothetical protein